MVRKNRRRGGSDAVRHHVGPYAADDELACVRLRDEPLGARGREEYHLGGRVGVVSGGRADGRLVDLPCVTDGREKVTDGAVWGEFGDPDTGVLVCRDHSGGFLVPSCSWGPAASSLRGHPLTPLLFVVVWHGEWLFVALGIGFAFCFVLWLWE